MDEFDFDTVPLDALAKAPATPATRVTPFVSRLGRRERTLRSGAIATTLLLAVAVLIAVTPGARTAVVGFVQGPTPTATPRLVFGQDRVALEDWVPWGVLTIDGRPGPQVGLFVPSTATTPEHVPTFALARGQHRLEYRADPFPTLQCTVSVPAAPTDTCPRERQRPDSLVAQGFDTRLLDLSAVTARLPAADASSLADAAQRALTAAAASAPPDALIPGDHYADAGGNLQLAGEALSAIPTYMLVRRAPTVSGAGPGSCAGLCSTPSPFAQSSADDWLVYGSVLTTWRYADANGQVFLADGPAIPNAQTEQSTPVQFGVRRVNGGWQVRLEPTVATYTRLQDLPLCTLASAALDNLRYAPGQSTISPNDAAYQWPASSALANFGCVLGGGDTDSQGTISGPLALVLYRCGALIAANDAAQRAFPEMPAASDAEQALALAAWPPTGASVGPGA